MSENATATAAPMRERIAEEIRALLARKRVSASKLARLMGVTQPYISRRLTGETALDVDDLDRIARALEVTVVDLLPREIRSQTTVAKVQMAVRPMSGRPRDSRPTGHPGNPSTRRPARLSTTGNGLAA